MSDGYNISINVNTEVNNAVSQLQQLENALKKFQNVTQNTKSNSTGLQETQRQTKAVSQNIDKSNQNFKEQMGLMNSIMSANKKGQAYNDGLTGELAKQNEQKLESLKIGEQIEIESAKEFSIISKFAGATKQFNQEQKSGLLATVQQTANLQKLAASMFALQNASQGLGTLYEWMSTPIKNVISSTKLWQDEMAQVARNYSATEDEFDLSNATLQLKEITSTLTTGVEELTQIASTGGQLGVAADQMGDFTKAVAMFDDVTGVAADQSAQSIGRIVNLGTEYIKVGDEMKRVDLSSQKDSYLRVANALTQLDLSANATASEIIEMGEQVSSVGKMYGYTTDEVLALSTAMSSVGIQAELGRTAFLRTNIAIERVAREGGEQFLNLQRITNMTGEQIKQSLGSNTQAIFQAFITGLKDGVSEGQSVAQGMEQIGINAIRNGQALNALVANYEQYIDLLNLARIELTSYAKLQEQTNQRNNTMNRQLELLSNNWVRFGSAMGDSFGGPATEGLKLINQIVLAFTRAMESGSGFTKTLAQIALILFTAGAGVAKIGQGYTQLLFQLTSMQFMFAYMGKGALTFSSLLKQPKDMLINLFTTIKSFISPAKEMDGALVGVGGSLKMVETDSKLAAGGMTAFGVATKVAIPLMAALAVGAVVWDIVKGSMAETEKKANDANKALKDFAKVDLSQALEEDTKTYQQTGEAVTTFTGLVSEEEAKLEGLEDQLKNSTQATIAYGKATSEAINNKLLENLPEETGYQNTNMYNMIKELEGIKTTTDEATFSSKTFFDILRTEGIVSANTYFTEFSSGMTDIQNDFNVLKNNLNGAVGPKSSVGGEKSDAYKELKNLDLAKTSFIELEELKKKFVNDSSVTNAIDQAMVVYEKWKLTGTATLDKLKIGQTLLNEQVTNTNNEVAKAADKMSLTHGAAKEYVEEMQKTKNEAEAALEKTKASNALETSLNNIASSSYKAANGLASMADQRKGIEEVQQYVTDLYETFEFEPTNQILGLVSALDTMVASGVNSGASFDYVFREALKTVQLLNDTYKLNINTSDAMGNVDVLKQNIISAINTAITGS
ncbi:MAG: phage tail tape measure protein, partial [Bifidobacteriaceae bacterium]|nr:phage tail tape measure protein [Bifidobacteriaceae bacterium]